MRTPKAAILMVALVTLIGATGGCGVAGQGDPGGGREATTKEEDRSGAPTQVTRGDDAATGTGRGQEPEGFAAASDAGGGTAGAADRIEGFRLEVFDGYERVLIDFGRRGGDASGVPEWSLERPAEGGYVRLYLPGVSSTATGYRDFVGLTTDAAYVVRDPEEGGLFVDVFALKSFRYRVTELPAGRLAVDFRPARDGLRFPPTQGENAVVVQPREAEEVRSPLTVEGYTRLPGARASVSLIGRDGETISSRTVPANVGANGGYGAWVPFETPLAFSDYGGLATLRVGGDEPSGAPRGVTFDGAKTEVVLE